MRRIARGSREGGARRDPRRAAAHRPLGRRHARSTPRSSAPTTAQTVVLAHGWTEALQLLDLRDPAGCRTRACGSSPTTCAATATASRRPSGDYAIERFGEDLEAVLGDLRARRRARGRGRPLARRDVDRRLGRATTTSSAGPAAPRCSTPGVGDLIAEQLILPLPAIAQAINRAIAVRGFLGSRTPLPRFSTPAQPRGDPLRRVRARRHAGAGGVLRADAGPRRPTCAPSVGIAMSEMDLHDALRPPDRPHAGDRRRRTTGSRRRRTPAGSRRCCPSSSA